MKKTEMIKSKNEFSNLIHNCHFIKNNFFIIYYKENKLDKKRYGIAISNKIGNAVTRNKLKRQTREILDKKKYLFKNSTDYIIMIRKGCLEADFLTRLNSMEVSLNKEKK